MRPSGSSEGPGEAGEPLGVGVVGCGRVARQWHLPALSSLSGARLVALADADPAALAAMGDRFGVSHRYGDHVELLENAGVDVIAVCVPASAHTEVAVAALEAGKHVLIEKPLALSRSDCERITTAAGVASGMSAVGFNLRHHRLVRRVVELARSGRLGRIELVRTAFHSPSRSRIGEPAWRWERSRGGGVLLEQGIHHLDLWRLLTGDEPKVVHAMQTGGDQTMVVNATTAGGILISSQFCDSSAPRNEFELHGTEASVRVSAYRFDGFELLPASDTAPRLSERARRPVTYLRELARAVPSIRLGGDYVASYRHEWLDFLRAIETGGPVAATVPDGARAVRLALATLASADSGEPHLVADAPPGIPAPAEEVEAL